MLGFAAVDRRSETVAIWLVSRTDPTEASSTNAVVVDLADEHALKKVHSLTRERVVIATPGSDLTGLPISDGHPTALLGEFIDATDAPSSSPWGPSRAGARPQLCPAGGSGTYHWTPVRRIRVSTFPSQLTPMPCSWRIGMTTVLISLTVVAS